MFIYFICIYIVRNMLNPNFGPQIQTPPLYPTPTPFVWSG